jgi:hypothetical protein
VMTALTSRARTAFAPETDVLRAATLLNREELLMEQCRPGSASYRRQLEIEEELSEIRRDLARLGFASSR